MAVFKTGSFTLGAAGANQSITGVGFQPKVVLFWLNYTCSGGSSSNDFYYVYGAASGSTARWSSAIGYRQQYGYTYMEFNDTACFKHGESNNAPSVVVEADFVSLDADGFTINVKTNVNTASFPAPTVYYTAIGGSDVSAKVGRGNFHDAASDSITGVGFQPKAILIAGNQNKTFIGPYGSDDISAHLGWATGTGAGEQGAIAYDFDNTAPSNNKSIQLDDCCFVRLNTTHDGTILDKGALSSFDADGFTITHSVRDTNASAFGYVALGGTAKYSTYRFNAPTATGNQSYSGTGVKPHGLLFFSYGLPASTATQDGVTLVQGAGDASTDRHTISWHSPDASSDTSSVDAIALADKIFARTDTSDTANSAADLVSLDDSGFTLNWTTASASTYSIFALGVGETEVIKLTPDTGSYAVTGNTLTTKRALKLSCSAGSYAKTGNNAKLNRGLFLKPSVGSYAKTGNNARLLRGFFLQPSVGSYTKTGNALATTKGWALTATSGSYAKTGSSLRTVRKLIRKLDSGSYTQSSVGIGFNPWHQKVEVTGLESVTGLGTATAKGVVYHLASGVYSATGVGTVEVTHSGSVVLTGNATSVALASVTASIEPITLRAKTDTISLRDTTGNQSITGLGFTPKLVIFYTDHQATESDASEWDRFYGAATSSTNRWVAAIAWTQGGNYNTSRFLANKCIQIESARNKSAPRYVADFVSMDSNGFTINATTAGAGFTCRYLAIGGSGFEAYCGTFNSAAATGNQTVTGPSFKSKAVVMACSAPRTDDDWGGDVAFSLGFATSASKTAATACYAQIQSGAAKATRAMKSNRFFIGVKPTSPPNMSHNADFVSHNDGPGYGFTLSWNVYPAMTTRIGYISLGGSVHFNVLHFDEPTTAQTQAVTGAGMSPVAELFMSTGKMTSLTSRHEVSQNADNDIIYTIGAASKHGANGGTTVAAYLDDGNTLKTQPHTIRSAPRSITFVSTDTNGTAASYGTVKSHDVDGFTVDWSPVTGAGSNIAALIFGETNVILKGMQSPAQTGTVTVKANASVAAPSLLTTSSLGSVSAKTIQTVEVTSVKAEGKTGFVDAIGRNNVLVSGVVSTVELGEEDAGHKTVISASGLASVSAVGSPDISGAASGPAGGVWSTTHVGGVTIPNVTTSIYVEGLASVLGMSSVTTNESHVEHATGVSAKFAVPPPLVVYHSKFAIMGALQRPWSAAAGSDNGGWDDVDPPTKGGWKRVPPA